MKANAENLTKHRWFLALAAIGQAFRRPHYASPAEEAASEPKPPTRARQHSQLSIVRTPLRPFTILRPMSLEYTGLDSNLQHPLIDISPSTLEASITHPVSGSSQAILISTLLPVIIACAQPVFAQTPDSVEEVTAFFRSSLNAPPAIEYFRFSEQPLAYVGLPPAAIEALKRSGAEVTGPGPIMHFEGAISGTNFYTGRFHEPTGNHGQSAAPIRIVVGRSGSTLYQVGLNELRIAHDEYDNPLGIAVTSQFIMVRQLFHMGIGSLREGSVTWDGSQFKAQLSDERLIEGDVEYADGLPASVIVKDTRNDQILYKLKYEFPDPINSLDGFPKVITRLKLSQKDVWEPAHRLELLECKVASIPLDKDRMSPNAFVDQNITFTNLYTNGISVATYADGSILRTKVPPVSQASTGVSRRVLVIVAIGAITLGMLLLWIKYARRTES